MVRDDKEGASVSVIVNRRAILVAVKSEQERKKEVYKAWYISVGVPAFSSASNRGRGYVATV